MLADGETIGNAAYDMRVFLGSRANTAACFGRPPARDMKAAKARMQTAAERHPMVNAGRTYLLAAVSDVKSSTRRSD